MLSLRAEIRKLNRCCNRRHWHLMCSHVVGLQIPHGWPDLTPKITKVPLVFCPVSVSTCLNIVLVSVAVFAFYVKWVLNILFDLILQFYLRWKLNTPENIFRSVQININYEKKKKIVIRLLYLDFLTRKWKNLKNVQIHNYRNKLSKKDNFYLNSI